MPDPTSLHLNGDFKITCDGHQGQVVTLMEKVGNDIRILPLTAYLNNVNVGHDPQSGNPSIQVNLGNGNTYVKP